MGNFRRITPFMHVPAIETALAFFEEVLGFKTCVRFSDHADLESRK